MWKKPQVGRQQCPPSRAPCACVRVRLRCGTETQKVPVPARAHSQSGPAGVMLLQGGLAGAGARLCHPWNARGGLLSRSPPPRPGAAPVLCWDRNTSSHLQLHFPTPPAAVRVAILGTAE